jgi:type VI secretion system protein ImpL
MAQEKDKGSVFGRIGHFLIQRWVISGIGALAFALLLWFLGPLLSFLSGAIVRLAIVVLIAAVWLIANLVLDLRAARRNSAMIAKATDVSQDKGVTADKASQDEAGTLRERLEEALAELRKSQSAGRSGQYLYQFPWYILIGPPGSGKTTALTNSGLKFPLSKKFGKDPLRGVGGTRNCDWWLSDEAILLDTAGRYTTQDSNEAVDQKAWLSFLRLLKEFRPRQPINGALVAIGLPDLLQMSASERSNHAHAIKNRLAELKREFGLKLPVYVIFTKADRIAGFTEFFDDLDREGRTNVWGMTFKLEMDSQSTASPAEEFNPEFERLVERLNQRLLERVHEERDSDRRGRIYGFPLQFGTLKPMLHDFLAEIFDATRFEDRQLLRGVYFTSATQEGTPIDRLMGSMSRAFGLADKAAPMLGGAGRSYFLTRLLKDVIFEEASLAGADPRAERRERLMRHAALAAVAVVAFFLIGAWVVSYLGNSALIADEQKAKDAYVAAATPLVQPTVADDNIATVMPVLDQLRGLPAGYDSAQAGAPLLRRFGLNTAPKLESQAVRAYRRALNGMLLPRLLVGIETQLKNNIDKPEYVNVFLPLYLELGGQGPLDKTLVNTAVSSLWGPRAYPNLQPADSTKRLQAHVDALVEEPVTPIALDAGLLMRARAVVANIPFPARAYSAIKESAAAKALPEWRIADHIGAATNQVLTRVSGKPLSQGVPGFFTYDGFNKVLLPQMPAAIKQVTDASWILGAQAGQPAGQDMNALREQIAAAYAADFISAWDQVLSDVTIIPFRNAQDAADVLGRLSQPSSPLKLFLVAAAQETTMNRATGGNNPAAAALAGAKAAANAAAGSAAGVLGSLAPAGDTAPKTAANTIDSHFQPLHDFVANAAAGQSQLDDVMKQLAQASTEIGGAPGAPGAPGAAPGGGTLARLGQQASRLPPPLGGILATATGKSTDIAAGASRKSIQDIYASTVLAFCRQAIDGRYPFARASTIDVGLSDFQQLMRPGGLLDSFFQTNLKPYVDTSGTPWKNQKANGADLGLSRAGLAEFELAQKIREDFFGANGAAIMAEFTLSPIEASSDVTQGSLDVEGQVLNFMRGQTPSQKMQWPAPNSSDKARLTLTRANGQPAVIETAGPWAFFRLLDRAKMDASLPDQMTIGFDANGATASFRLRASSVRNPFHARNLAQFQCAPQL